MYNRYIPQSDGSYRRNRMQEQAQQVKPAPQPAAEQFVPPPPAPSNKMGAGDFLRRLLPKNLDTEDLLIIVLLLLMTGDGKEEKNTALITLALYFFL